MSTTWVIIIIVLVLGVVIGNITLLKYSAKFKFPTPSKPFDDNEDDNQPKSTGGSHASSNTQNENSAFAQSQTSQGLTPNKEKQSSHGENAEKNESSESSQKPGK